MAEKMKTIGVLALQGAFSEHVAMLEKCKVLAKEVRLPNDLEGLDGLIIPGGESTTFGKLATLYDLFEPIRTLGQQGLPIWGTCAGMILLAKDVGHDQPLLKLMDITVRRNAFGRQIDSFEQDIEIPLVNKALGLPERRMFPAIFIRAPLIIQTGKHVEKLAVLVSGDIVAVRQDNYLATSFHPELTRDLRFHKFFLSFV